MHHSTHHHQHIPNRFGMMHPQPQPPHTHIQQLTSVPPPNVGQQPHNMHMGNRINHHHHHPRVGGHQMTHQPPIQIQQNPRKLPHNNGMVIEHQQLPKPLQLQTSQPQASSNVAIKAGGHHHHQPTSSVGGLSPNTTPVVSAITSTIISNHSNPTPPVSNKQPQRIIQGQNQYIPSEPKTVPQLQPQQQPAQQQNVVSSSSQIIPTATLPPTVIPQQSPDSSTIVVVNVSADILLDKDDDSSSETLANIKEKTPMCLVNELARYNKIQHQYRLTSECGPAHKKRFTVTLKLGDEEYTAEGPSIKKAQHTAAHEAISKTKYKHPPAKTNRMTRSGTKRDSLVNNMFNNITPTVELNALAMKRGEPTVYEAEPPIVINDDSAVGVQGPNIMPPPQGSHFMPHQPPPQAPPPSHGNYRYNQHMYPSQANTMPGRYGGYDRRQNPGGRGGGVNPNNRGNYYNGPSPTLELYRVTLHVGDRTFLGQGFTLQMARHDAASKALEVLKPLTPDTTAAAESADTTMDSDDLNSDLKSPISLVHEMALKRKLSVIFEVQSEKGPPHMKVFVTLCKVGDIVTEGEGNGKKLSKKRAAEKMLDELKKLPPPSPEQSPRTMLKQKRRVPVVKKKTRNLIKEKPEQDFSEEVNPISRLMQIQQAKKEKEPTYTLIEERGVARRREFIIEVAASGNTAIGAGPNKKIAKKVAAENLLSSMGYGKTSPSSMNKEVTPKAVAVNVNEPIYEKQRKVKFVDDSTEPKTSPNQGGSAGRQIAPGVLLMNNPNSNKPVSLPATSSKSGISVQQTATIAQELLAEGTSPTAEAITKTTTTNNTTAGETGRIKDQLMYLAQLLNFDVLFSDFPKGNHGEYLTLVTLSTDPPQLCHGSGSSLVESQDEAARGALEMLSKIGLDNVKSSKQSADKKPKPILTNGVKN